MLIIGKTTNSECKCACGGISERIRCDATISAYHASVQYTSDFLLEKEKEVIHD